MVPETMDIKIEKATKSRIAEVDWDNLLFGREFSDHMFVMEYADGIKTVRYIARIAVAEEHNSSAACCRDIPC